MNVDSSLIYLICGFCDCKSIYNIMSTCKNYNQLKLYRMLYGYIIACKFSGSIQALIDDNNKFIKNFIIEKYWKLNDYIADIADTFYEVELKKRISRRHFGLLYFNTSYKISNQLTIIMNSNSKSHKFESDLESYKFCHNLFRIRPLEYKKLRKKHFTVLSLIY